VVVAGVAAGVFQKRKFGENPSVARGGVNGNEMREFTNREDEPAEELRKMEKSAVRAENQSVAAEYELVLCGGRGTVRSR